MKSTIRTEICSLIVALLVFSCASTPQPQSATNNQVQTGETAAVVAELSPSPPSASEIYSQKVSSSKLMLLSSPKETTKGKIFTSPYLLKVEDSDGKPIASYEITVIYPASRKNGEVIFAETAITSDSEGKAEFLPPAPEFAFNSHISFYPKYLAEELSTEEKAKIDQIAQENTIRSPFKVQTNQKSAGGVIAVVDFNQNGKAITSNPVSSSKLLMTLMKLGFTKIGNAPQDVTDAVIQDNEQRILSRAKAIAPSFIIYGSVKIDSLEKSESGITYTLTGLVKSMDIKTGEITFKTEKTLSVTEKNDWTALDNARKALSDAIANEIKYGI
ncbi:MAG: hypothetical protein IJ158_04325 [Treponema sp.]|nr:hypothetical protein [Treponema sp.]